MSDRQAENDTDSQQPIVKSEDEFAVHRQMVVWLFIATTLVAVVLGVALFFRLHGAGATLLVTVMTAGALGGFVSSLRRLYRFGSIFPSSDFSRWLQKANLYVAVYSSIPPLVGAIAAVVLYLLFASDLLSGTFFPEFDCRGGDPSRCTEFNVFLLDWRPKTPTDVAKALVWGFVAGFSERFVPSVLHRATAESLKEPSRRAT